MSNVRRAAALSLAGALLPLAPLAAQDGAAKEQAATSIDPQVRSRDLSGTFGGQRVSYTATIKENVLSSDDGTPEAVIVTTSYVRNPRDTSRPVFFIYNGGPGSGSGWRAGSFSRLQKCQLSSRWLSFSRNAI